mmetsp:Transcript_66850/g.136161  ORF Transcript_66850/g.136161 Transcript_66850/m.136161 type:complete len:84 (+) Transcript_66850:202-453(+)
MREEASWYLLPPLKDSLSDFAGLYQRKAAGFWNYFFDVSTIILIFDSGIFFKSGSSIANLLRSKINTHRAIDSVLFIRRGCCC